MGMKFLRVHLSDVNLKRVGADLAVCSLCGGKLWHIYQPDDTPHVHYQCGGCAVSYCPGGCKAQPQPQTETEDPS